MPVPLMPPPTTSRSTGSFELTSDARRSDPLAAPPPAALSGTGSRRAAIALGAGGRPAQGVALRANRASLQGRPAPPAPPAPGHRGPAACHRTRCCPTMKFGIGQPVPRKEDPRLVAGQRPLRRRRRPAGPGLRASSLRSPQAHGRAAPARRRRGAGRAGRARGLHRGRHGARRLWPAAVQAAAQEPRRQPAVRAAAPDLGDATGCATSASRWRWWWPRARARGAAMRPS